MILTSLITRYRVLKMAVTAGATVGVAAIAYGQPLQLSSMFSNGMVLQQKMADPIWGWATPGATITIHFAGHIIKTMANNRSQWMTRLPELIADAHPQVLTVASGGHRLTIKDILIGEVWLCAGQSNMQYPMSGWFGRKNLAARLARAHHPHIRLYQVPMLEKYFVGYPRSTVDARWQVCTPQTAAPFSAVGYMFGRRLEKKLHVPIGLIESDWGGTNIEAWTPLVGDAMTPELKTDNQWLGARLPLVLAQRRQFINATAQWTRAAAKCLAHRLPLPPQPPQPSSDAIRQAHAFHYDIRPVGWQPDPHQNPTTLFNGMIAPLIPYGIRGAIWYQGENNVLTHDRQYYYHLKALIGGWRKLWRQGAFPFYIMQIAPCKYWQAGKYEPLVWQGEEKAAETIKNCGIAPTMDIGEIKNIHPRNKPAAARRIANVALACTYHLKGVTWAGPMFKSAAFHGGTVVVHFKHEFGGLAAKGGAAPNWFEIAGPGGHFVPAQATIVGRTVVVKAASVTDAAAVRFAWSDVAVPNLFNAKGWPALPFEASAKH